MKRISTIIIAILILSCSYSLNAQFSKDTKIVSAGLSLGLYGKYFHDYADVNLNRVLTPPINLQFEKGISESSGLGELSSMITAGVFIGFQKQRYYKDVNTNMVTYEVYKNYNYFWGGVVGTLHAVQMINDNTTIEIDAEKLDIYASVKCGVVFENYNSNYLNDPTDIDVQMGTINEKDTKTFFYIGPVLGARYYFTDKFAFFGEIGRSNLSYMTIGASMKL